MGIDERIKERRAVLGMSQSELAEMLGLSGVTVSKWESGLNRPKGSHMVELATALGVSMEWLLNGDVQPTKNRLTKDELEIIELFRSASLTTKMRAFQILSGEQEQTSAGAGITNSGNNSIVAGRDIKR